MATRVILALILSLLFIFQVSSDSRNSEETSNVSQSLHVFSGRGDRKLMYNLVIEHLSKYFKNRLISGASALAPAPAPGPAPDQIDCDGLCKKRCSLHSRPNLCLRACGTCCFRCNCVPPGTFGNRQVCGKCYTDMTTHGNKTKCP